MRKEEFTYDSRDGIHKLHGVRYLPAGEVVGIVQIVHGMSEHIGRYGELAQFLTEKGFLVTGEDHLGHGGSVPSGEPYGYFCQQDPATVIVRDVHRLKKMTQEAYPGLPYIIIGHSMGSFILRSYLSKYGTGIDGAILLGTGYRSTLELVAGKLVAGLLSKKDGPKAAGKLLHKLSFRTYQRMIESPRTSNDWLTKCSDEVELYEKDQQCGFVFTVNGFETLFELVSRIQKREEIEKIPKNLPIHLMSGLDDPVGNYGRGVQMVYDSYRAAGLCGVTMKLYPGDRHELLKETDRGQVMEDIADWIQEVCAKGRT